MRSVISRMMAHDLRRMLPMMAPLLVAAAPAPEPGPEPDRTQAIAVIEQTIRANLIDPDSARFTWPYDFNLLTTKVIFSKTWNGWTTCGTVNARNRMGGYTGASAVKVVFDKGAVLTYAIDSSDGINLTELFCAKLLKDGMMHPYTAPLPVAAAAPLGAIGFQYAPTPFGTVILSVVSGSPAGRAGLKAGETIEAANGVLLKGMDQPTSASVFAGLPATFTFTIVGVGEVRVVR
jgi:hypothetical protein